jgi:hypothetical protein
MTKISYDSTRSLKYFYIVLFYGVPLLLGALCLLQTISVIHKLMFLVTLGLFASWGHQFVKKLSTEPRRDFTRLHTLRGLRYGNNFHTVSDRG